MMHLIVLRTPCVIWFPFSDSCACSQALKNLKCYSLHSHQILHSSPLETWTFNHSTFCLPHKAQHYNPPVITRSVLSLIHLHFNYNYDAFILTASSFWRIKSQGLCYNENKGYWRLFSFLLRCFPSQIKVKSNLCQDVFSLQENIMEVMRNQEFLLLPAEELHKLLASDDVNVPDEETIFHALMMWVKYDMQRRCNDLSMLLAFIRLPLLPPQVTVSDAVLAATLHWKLLCWK